MRHVEIKTAQPPYPVNLEHLYNMYTNPRWRIWPRAEGDPMQQYIYPFNVEYVRVSFLSPVGASFQLVEMLAPRRETTYYGFITIGSPMP